MAINTESKDYKAGHKAASAEWKAAARELLNEIAQDRQNTSDRSPHYIRAMWGKKVSILNLLERMGVEE